MNTKKLYIIIAVLIGILVILMVIYNLSSSQKSNPQQNSTSITPAKGVYYSPTPVHVSDVTYLIPRRIESVPTLAPEQGEGLDINSPEILNSIAEIKKVLPYLPYHVTFTSASKVPVEIVIPTFDLQENPWTLTIHIYGPDYQISADNIKAAESKSAFLEASNEVYYWLKSKNVNTENIIIKWGDRAFIQDRSEEWLN